MWIDFLNLMCPFADKWSPALQIRTVLLSIQALLSAPNPDDPLANDVAEQWKVNESQAIETGKLLLLVLLSTNCLHSKGTWLLGFIVTTLHTIYTCH